MIDLFNFIIGAICAFILGAAAHSVYLHERARRGWRFPWDHDDGGIRWEYVGNGTREGWSGSMPFYRGTCPRHGVVETYPQGYEGRLECPECVKEGLP